MSIPAMERNGSFARRSVSPSPTTIFVAGSTRCILADVVIAGEDVREIAVAATVETLDVERHVLGEAGRSVGLHRGSIEPTVTDPRLGRRRGAGIGGPHQNGATRRIAPEQGALGTLEYLDVLNPHQLKVGYIGVGL